MPDAPVPERNLEIGEEVERILGLLLAEDAPATVVYRGLIQDLTDLSRSWREHVAAFGRTFASVGLEGREEESVFMAQLQKDSFKLADQLDTLSGAGWPRTMGLGLNALRVRVATLLTAILLQIEKEQLVWPTLQTDPELDVIRAASSEFVA